MVGVLDAQITSLQEEYATHVAATKNERTRLVAAFDKRVKALKESADRAYRTAETSGAKHSREMNSLRSSLAKDGYAVGELSKQLASTSSELTALKKRERDYKLELAKAIAACRDAETEQQLTRTRLEEAEARANSSADEACAHKRRLADVAANHAALTARATAATASTAAVEAKVEEQPPSAMLYLARVVYIHC
jgi:chromosome segregation ATPase